MNISLGERRVLHVLTQGGLIRIQRGENGRFFHVDCFKRDGHLVTGCAREAFTSSFASGSSNPGLPALTSSRDEAGKPSAPDFVSGEGIRAAALVTIRDGSDDLRREHGAWVEQTLMDALSAPDDVAHRMRGGLKFNPVATASFPLHILRSPAWRPLSPVARCIFLELAAVYNGGSNGFITLSTRDAAKHVRCSKDTAARAFVELAEKGFIVCCSRGHFDRKSPHASEYCLTLYSYNRTGEKASKAFMLWQPGQAKSVAGPMRGTTGPTTETVTNLTKENYRPQSNDRDRRASSEPLSGPTTGTHIIYQMGSGVEVVKDSVDASGGQPLRRLRHAS